MEPTGNITFEEHFLGLDAFMQQFREIPAGSIVYQIIAYQNPTDNIGIYLGDVVTKNKCVTSYFGDTKLFFKHQYITEDMELRPEWAEAYESN